MAVSGISCSGDYALEASQLARMSNIMSETESSQAVASGAQQRNAGVEEIGARVAQIDLASQDGVATAVDVQV